MELEKIVNSQGEEIKSLFANLNQIQTDLQLLLKDHKYLSEKVSQISSDISDIIKGQENLNNSVTQFSNYMNTSISWRNWFDRNWWRLLTYFSAFIALLWAVMDFLYKLEPPK